MRLSEAIRLGAMLRPQAFGRLRVDGGSCALGAAYEAAGILRADGETVALHALMVTFPLMDQDCGCPVPHCYLQKDELGEIVAHLNDEHRWTRNAIADFVASCEPPIDPPVAVDAIGLSPVPVLIDTAR